MTATAMPTGWVIAWGKRINVALERRHSLIPIADATSTNAYYRQKVEPDLLMQQQHSGPQHLDTRFGLAQKGLHSQTLRTRNRYLYAHGRGTSLMLGLFCAKPFIHQVVPLFDTVSAQLI